ncbi:MAG TPA: TetR/AcrR family transcriptional regulator [Mycobacterium sp.]|nr:TetR/AcrR family transcriptional regulator [Mycobacterium sp.]
MTDSTAPVRRGAQPAGPHPGREKQKSDRRAQLLTAAAALMAERGYLAVRLEDIGAAAGISGPAIYRHFPGKEALLVELLVGISTRLLDGAREVVAAESVEASEAQSALDRLIEFHLDFALTEPDLIRIQDRDLASLPVVAQRQVRRAQRSYVETWVGVLTRLHADLAEDDARVMAHAVFGLMNSTAHSIKSAGARSTEHSRDVLRAMTRAALAPPAPDNERRQYQ